MDPVSNKLKPKLLYKIGGGGGGISNLHSSDLVLSLVLYTVTIAFIPLGVWSNCGLILIKYKKKNAQADKAQCILKVRLTLVLS